MNAYKGAKNRIVKKRGRECYEIKLIEQLAGIMAVTITNINLPTLIVDNLSIGAFLFQLTVQPYALDKQHL